MIHYQSFGGKVEILETVINRIYDNRIAVWSSENISFTSHCGHINTHVVLPV